MYRGYNKNSGLAYTRNIMKLTSKTCTEDVQLQFVLVIVWLVVTGL